ncbi:hypothetical protein Leryth_023741 [Lithospermum erythrorhizon]|nr:hypothetical protein Leryth_023741 [Lithospermum erythrorhizon]
MSTLVFLNSYWMSSLFDNLPYAGCLHSLAAEIRYYNIYKIKKRKRSINSTNNDTLDDLIAICKRMVDEEELQFHEEYINEQDQVSPFLLSLHLYVSSKQLRDDLMTLLIAGHETSAAFCRDEDIFISVWNLHHCPSRWEDADKFNPERWPLDGPNPNETNQNFSYLPFGGGPRKCIGDQFATFENVVAVAMLVRRFNFQMALGAPSVEMTTGATIHTTGGLVMSVTCRTRPASNIINSDSEATPVSR